MWLLHTPTPPSCGEALTRWLEREDDEELRAELVEALGYHADARTLGLLARIGGRDDRSSRVRSEAVKR